ncbi:MAG: hypothetical protein AAGA32_10520 [Pseudomonadota bacterium]
MLGGADLPEIVRTASFAVAAAGGVFAVVRGLVELRLARQLRERELRWSQAKLTREIFKDFEADPQYRAACKMLDWRRYSFEEGVEVRRAEVWPALRVENVIFDEKERFIREAFIGLMNTFEWLEHFLRTDLVRLEDVAPILEYRVGRMAEEKPVFERFLRSYSYVEAEAFLCRFTSWTDRTPQRAD